MLTREVAVKQGFTNKRCPKCGGNIFLDRDICGWHEQCLQCGRSSDLPEIVEFLRQGEKGEKEIMKVPKS